MKEFLIIVCVMVIYVAIGNFIAGVVNYSGLDDSDPMEDAFIVLFWPALSILLILVFLISKVSDHIVSKPYGFFKKIGRKLGKKIWKK